MARLLDHRRRQRSRVQAWPGDRTPCRRPGARNRKGRARPDAGRAQDSGLNEKGEKGMIMLRIGLASAIAMAAAMAGGSAQARPAAAQSPPGYPMPPTQTWALPPDSGKSHHLFSSFPKTRRAARKE